MLVVKATNRTDRWQTARPSRVAGRGFTLIDLLVSMAIIAVLIALILPSLSGVREATRRVICSSNIRQQGLGLQMYQEDWKGELPPTDYEKIVANTPKPQNTNVVRREGVSDFDGLGILFSAEYLNAPQVFYCPSHHGDHPQARYMASWYVPDVELVSNFQYRGTMRIVPGQAERPTLVTDGLASQSDYSHKIGTNVLRADLSVAWLPDPSGAILRLLPLDPNDQNAAARVLDAWNLIESPAGVPGP